MNTKLRDAIRLVMPDVRVLVLSVVLSIVQVATFLPIAMLIRRIVDVAIPTNNLRQLEWTVVELVALLMANALITLWNRDVTLRAIKRGVRVLREQLADQTFVWELHRFGEKDMDTMHTRIVQDTERIDMMVSALLTQFVPGMLIALGLSVVLLVQQWKLFAVVAVVLGLLYAFGKWLGAHVRQRTQQFHQDFSRFSAGISFLLSFHSLITISTAEAPEREKQYRSIADVQESSRRMAWLGTLYTLIQGQALMVTGVLVLFVGGWNVMQGTMTMGTLLSFYVVLNLFSTSIRTALASIPVLIEGEESFRSLSPLLSSTKSSLSQKPFEGFRSAITIEDVQFSHVPNVPVLHDVRWSIAPRQVVGIFGASGSGKTTLMHLLLGIYAPDRGRICVNGEDLRALDLASYRRRCGVVPQDPLLFSGTIRENITYGLTTVSEDLIRRVCVGCRVQEVIEECEHGLDTEIGDRGVNLSGGQRQRLALARALIREPELLILDEPTNHLDDAMWQDIFSFIRSLPMTVIVISHDRRLIPQLDGYVELPSV